MAGKGRTTESRPPTPAPPGWTECRTPSHRPGPADSDSDGLGLRAAAAARQSLALSECQDPGPSEHGHGDTRPASLRADSYSDRGSGSVAGPGPGGLGQSRWSAGAAAQAAGHPASSFRVPFSAASQGTRCHGLGLRLDLVTAVPSVTCRPELELEVQFEVPGRGDRAAAFRRSQVFTSSCCQVSRLLTRTLRDDLPVTPVVYGPSPAACDRPAGPRLRLRHWRPPGPPGRPWQPESRGRACQ
jgi:hypothetical protein